MRHRIEKKKLSRDMDHRKALLMNLAQELINHEKITTTIDKAKYVRPHVEKLITKAKQTVGNDDKVKNFNILKDMRKDLGSESALKKLFEVLAVRYKDTKGGYTRTVRTGVRGGDNAVLARIEFVKQDTPKTAVKPVEKVIEEPKNEK
jgi:large subunit ribosomal protein L17